MIDPQTQANKFIKKMGSQTEGVNLDVFKLSEQNLIRSLELAIQFGKWVLLFDSDTWKGATDASTNEVIPLTCCLAPPFSSQ